MDKRNEQLFHQREDIRKTNHALFECQEKRRKEKRAYLKR